VLIDLARLDAGNENWLIGLLASFALGAGSADTPAGNPIQDAIDKIAAILKGNNDCAKFFNSGAQGLLPDSKTPGADALASDHVTKDKSGPATITQEDDGKLAQPYGARTAQNAGLNADIYLNPHGAFYETTAFVRDSSGLPVKTKPNAPLTIGGTSNPYQYSGGSIQAQAVILLHELAHTLNLIPADGKSPGQSLTNTQTILDKCKAEIDKLKK
jgi:hypothetical protein